MSLAHRALATLTHWGRDQNEQHFADDIFKRIFFNENVWVSIKMSLKVLPKGPINNIPALVRIMAWRRSGDKPLSEPMMVSLSTHICVTRPQWVNSVQVTVTQLCKLWLKWIVTSHTKCTNHTYTVSYTLRIPGCEQFFAYTCITICVLQPEISI